MIILFIFTVSFQTAISKDSFSYGDLKVKTLLKQLYSGIASAIAGD
jgi:hypothetical protein